MSNSVVSVSFVGDEIAKKHVDISTQSAPQPTGSDNLMESLALRDFNEKVVCSNNISPCHSKLVCHFALCALWCLINGFIFPSTLQTANGDEATEPLVLTDLNDETVRSNDGATSLF